MGKSCGRKIIWRIVIMLGLSISFVITGCAQTKGEFVKFTADIYPPKSQAQENLLARGDINKPYKEFGHVKAWGNEYSNEEECFEKIRQIAKDSGADAEIKAHAQETESFISKIISTGKFPRTVTFKGKNQFVRELRLYERGMGDK